VINLRDSETDGHIVRYVRQCDSQGRERRAHPSGDRDDEHPADGLDVRIDDRTPKCSGERLDDFYALRNGDGDFGIEVGGQVALELVRERRAGDRQTDGAAEELREADKRAMPTDEKGECA
jgi:hypothetical protein